MTNLSMKFRSLEFYLAVMIIGEHSMLQIVENQLEERSMVPSHVLGEIVKNIRVFRGTPPNPMRIRKKKEEKAHLSQV